MANEFAKKNKDDLMKFISEKREALRAFRFAKEGSKTRNVREGRNLRRDIARALTAMSVNKSGK